MAIFIAILTIGILVILHEMGHFFVAKKFGIKIEEFGVGLPPRLFGKKYGETIYSVNALPIGGFVRMEGEEKRSDSPAVSAKNPSGKDFALWPREFSCFGLSRSSSSRFWEPHTAFPRRLMTTKKMWRTRMSASLESQKILPQRKPACRLVIQF